jgi:hypothetical protein
MQAAIPIGRTATNPQTGERIAFDGQQWVPFTPPENMPSKGIAGDVEVLGTGVRQGLETLGGLPNEMMRSGLTYTAPDVPIAEDPIGAVYDRRRREKALAAEKGIRETAAAATERLPTAQQLSDYFTAITGLQEVEPQNARQRIIQATGQGAGSGAIFGPLGIAGGAVGGVGSQSAAELGAPEWAQTAVGIGLPLLTGRLGTPRPKAPTTAQLRSSADAAYADSRAQGVIVSQPAMSNVVGEIESAARKEYLSPVRHPKSSDALQQLKDEVAAGPMSLDHIDALRQKVLGDVAKSSDAGERRIARLMLRRLDEQIEALTPADVLSGDPQKAVAALREGQANWAKMRKAQTIEDAADKATRRAAKGGSGGNINNALKQEIDAILNNRAKLRGFTKEEQALMRKIVGKDGISVDNMMRLVGKLSPSGNGLSMWLNLAAAAQTGGASLPLTAVGIAAKTTADRATKRAVEQLLEAVQSGQIPASSMTPTLRQTLEAVIRASGGAAGQAVPDGQ